jgi:septum formation protein
LKIITPDEQLVLASRSPRRAEILTAVGWPFVSIVAGIDETRFAGEDAVAYVKRLAHTKAAKVAKTESGKVVLGADTVVQVEGEILGQPIDSKDAKRMLRLLSGKWHQVVTGVALVREGTSACSIVDHVVTKVRFAELTDDEIEWYVASKEPMDKAGAYAIQGKAAPFIAEIQGDYFNIVGLPIRRVYELLQRIRNDTRTQV